MGELALPNPLNSLKHSYGDEYAKLSKFNKSKRNLNANHPPKATLGGVFNVHSYSAKLDND